MSEYMLKRRELMLGIRPPDPKKESKPIPKRSEKMKGEMKDYNKLVKEMLLESDRCEMLTPGCTGKAQGLQHMKRRGKNLLDKKYLKRSCNACNLWSELNPIEAIKMGIAISVHKKEQP